MSEHAPTPWRELEGYISSDGHGYVVLITPFREDAHRDKHRGPTQEAQANARFIVRACNAHEALLEAAKPTRDLLRKAQYTGTFFGESLEEDKAKLDALDKAITLAEGKKP